MRQLVRFVFIALSLAVASPVGAQSPAPAAQTAPPAAPAKPPAEEWSTTQHTLKLGAQTIPYTAKAGTTAIKDDDGETLGLMYSVSYVRSDNADAGVRGDDTSTRPVTFLFNGGRDRPPCGCTWDRSGRSAS